MSKTFMNHCRFECTAEALEEVVYDMQDGIDLKSLSESENKGYQKMLELCKTIIELDKDYLNPNNGD